MTRKVVHIINDLRKGGTNNCFVNLISEIDPNATIICINKKDYYYDYLLLKEFKVYYLDNSSILKFLSSFYKIMKILKKERFSILSCWLYKSCLFGGFFAMFFRNKKVIWNIRHSDTSFNIKYLKKFAVIRLCSIITKIKKINIIYNSYCAMESHKKIGFKSPKIEVINNSFDTFKFKNSKNKKNFLERYRIQNNKIIISMYGRYHPIKNHLTLLESISQIYKIIPDIHLFLAGQGINNQNLTLKKAIKSFKIEKITTLAGFLGEEELIDAYSSSDLTVLTSSSESFPNVIGESMSCMTPCVSFNVGDCKKLIGNTGWITKKNNLSSLISTLEKAINFTRKRTDWLNMRNRCHQRIRDSFNYEKEIAKHLKFYQKIK